QGVLDHEAGNTGACIKDGENEKSFEHHGKVIPQGHHSAATQSLGKNVGHANGERGSATGAVEESFLANSVSQGLHVGRGYGKSPVGDGGGGCNCGLPYDSGWAVNCEINAGLQHTGSDDRHDSDG